MLDQSMVLWNLASSENSPALGTGVHKSDQFQSGIDLPSRRRLLGVPGRRNERLLGLVLCNMIEWPHKCTGQGLKVGQFSRGAGGDTGDNFLPQLGNGVPQTRSNLFAHCVRVLFHQLSPADILRVVHRGTRGE